MAGRADIRGYQKVDIVELSERVSASADPAARALAETVKTALADPDKRVGTAFGLRRRGGEPRSRAKIRTQRDEDLCELARQIVPDRPIEEQAREISRRVNRYVPTAADLDGSGVRQLLRRIVESGPLPKRSRLKQILAADRNSVACPAAGPLVSIA